MKRKTRKATRFLLAGAATVTTAPFAGAGIADAYGPTGYTHNICGAQGCSHFGNTAITRVLKDQLRYFRAGGGVPASVLLQEVCASQFNDFKNFLRGEINGNFYGGHYASSSQTTYCGSTEPAWLGPASYLVSASNPHDRGGVYKRTYASQNGSEQRGLVCLYGDSFGTPYYACATHLAVGTTHNAQFRELYSDVIQYYAQATRVYWGGDFNMRSADMTAADPNFAFSLNQEADMCYGSGEQWTFRSQSTGALSKIDFLLRSGINRQACPVDAALTPATSGEMFPVGTFTSDHRIMNGGQPF